MVEQNGEGGITLSNRYTHFPANIISSEERASVSIDGKVRYDMGTIYKTKRAAELVCCSFVECPAKLSNFFEDFNKIVEFIEKHCVLNKGYNINSL